MISLSYHLIRTLYFITILTQFNIFNKSVFCEPQRGPHNRRVLHDQNYDDYSSPIKYDYYEDRRPNEEVMNFMTELTEGEKEANKALLNELTKVPVNARGIKNCDRRCTQCLASCNHIKSAKGANSAPLVQYLYLAVCAKGCKKMIGCITDKYCLPVMKENPDYFIQCVNSCPLFPIIPKVFIK